MERGDLTCKKCKNKTDVLYNDLCPNCYLIEDKTKVFLTEKSNRCHQNENKSLTYQVGGNHYKNFKIQPIEFIYKNNIPFIEANIIKYVCRHRFKDGKEDLLKARHYIDMLLELEYNYKPEK